MRSRVEAADSLRSQQLTVLGDSLSCRHAELRSLPAPWPQRAPCQWPRGSHLTTSAELDGRLGGDGLLNNQPVVRRPARSPATHTGERRTRLPVAGQPRRPSAPPRRPYVAFFQEARSPPGTAAHRLTPETGWSGRFHRHVPDLPENACRPLLGQLAHLHNSRHDAMLDRQDETRHLRRPSGQC